MNERPLRLDINRLFGVYRNATVVIATFVNPPATPTYRAAFSA
jgi:hypothetical protein